LIVSFIIVSFRCCVVHVVSSAGPSSTMVGLTLKRDTKREKRGDKSLVDHGGIDTLIDDCLLFFVSESLVDHGGIDTLPKTESLHQFLNGPSSTMVGLTLCQNQNLCANA